MRQQHDSAQAENAVGGEFRLQHEQDECRDDQRECRVACGQKVQCEERQQNENHADHSRHNRAGMVEFSVERQRAHGQHQEGDIGIE